VRPLRHARTFSHFNPQALSVTIWETRFLATSLSHTREEVLVTFAPRALLQALASGLLVALVSTFTGCDRREPEPGSNIVLSWSRQGGLAGFCDQLSVTVAGDAAASSCTAREVKKRKLSSDELTKLNEWRAAFGSVTATSKDEATADAMSMTLTLSGTGQGQPSERQRQELLDWAQRVYQETK
jgi:hypothetical protein